ncbi:type II secretion system protein [bacterium]|nr:type II secretion system protein [bacterium]MBQ6436393.1 type II secretion system protein [bacterium]
MKKQAFTLIELLVVIAIIAILATLAVANFSQAVKKSRDARRKSDITNLQQALVLYRADNGAYPKKTGNVSSIASTLTSGGYMSAVPSTSSTGGNYYYTSSDGKTFKLCSDELEVPKASGANATSNSGANLNCNNASNSSCKFFCLTNP